MCGHMLVPLLPFRHPGCLLSVPAGGRRLAVRPDTPWSTDGNAAPTPRWTDPCLTRGRRHPSVILRKWLFLSVSEWGKFSPFPGLRREWQEFCPSGRKPRMTTRNPWTPRRSRRRYRPRCASAEKRVTGFQHQRGTTVMTRSISNVFCFYFVCPSLPVSAQQQSKSTGPVFPIKGWREKKNPISFYSRMDQETAKSQFLDPWLYIILVVKLELFS